MRKILAGRSPPNALKAMAPVQVRRHPPDYTDTAAFNGIHAIMCRHGGPAAGGLDDIGEVLARAGRPIIQVCDIQTSVVQTRGPARRRVGAGATSVWSTRPRPAWKALQRLSDDTNVQPLYRLWWRVSDVAEDGGRIGIGMRPPSPRWL
jgi:hypothetical protein